MPIAKKGAVAVGKGLGLYKSSEPSIADTYIDGQQGEMWEEPKKKVPLGERFIKGVDTFGKALGATHKAFDRATPFVKGVEYGGDFQSAARFGVSRDSGAQLSNKLAYLSGAGGYGSAGDISGKVGVLVGNKPGWKGVDAVDLIRLNRRGVPERSFKSKASMLLGLPYEEEPLVQEVRSELTSRTPVVSPQEDRYEKITADELARAFRKQVRGKLEIQGKPQQRFQQGNYNPYIQPIESSTSTFQEPRFGSFEQTPVDEDTSSSPTESYGPAPLTIEGARARWPNAQRWDEWRPGLKWSEKSQGWKTYLRKKYTSHKPKADYEY